MVKTTEPKKAIDNAGRPSRYWWVMLIQGAIMLFVGWLLLKQPMTTVLNLVVLLGLYWLIAGIMDVITSVLLIKSHESWGWKLFGGVIGIIAGLLVLNNPIFAGVLTPVIMMYIIAFIFIINGIVSMIVGNHTAGGERKWSWGSFFLGIIYLLFGFMLLSSPQIVSVATLVLTTGVLGIVGGIGLMIFSFYVRGHGE